MTESESVVYRVVPKCACSTIGQIMYFSDHNAFYDGDIHDAEGGIHKWAIEASQARITENVLSQKTYTFTCVRNPYTRILSSFLTKFAASSAMETGIAETWCLWLFKNTASKSVVQMVNRNLIKSNPFAGFYCLSAIPSVGANRWIRISTGLQCPDT